MSASSDRPAHDGERPHGALEDALEVLYAGGFEDFIARRKSLVKQLRDDGAREESRAVASAKKPTLLAWALDQVALHDAPLLDELFAASDDFRAAHGRALSRKRDEEGRADELRDARRRQRDAVERVVERALDHLRRAGHGAPVGGERRLHDTLHAAAFGPPDAREPLRRGWLARELESTSGLFAFGSLPFELPPPTAARTRAREDDAERRYAREQRRSDDEATARRRYDEARQALAELERAAQEAADEAAALERMASDAVASAERARSRAEGLVARLEAARDDVERATREWRAQR